mgnify:CR=1 FL=1
MNRPAFAIVAGHGLDAVTTAIGFCLTRGSAIEANPIVRGLANAVALYLLNTGSSLPVWTAAGITVGVAKLVVAVLAAVGLVAAARYLDVRVVAVYGYLLGGVGAVVAITNVGVMLL